MALKNQNTGSNSSSPFVFLHGGAGAGWIWQPHSAQLSNYHSQFLDQSRHDREGKKAGDVQENKVKKWLPIPQKTETREVEQCCLNTCLATS